MKSCRRLLNILALVTALVAMLAFSNGFAGDDGIVITEAYEHPLIGPHLTYYVDSSEMLTSKDILALDQNQFTQVHAPAPNLGYSAGVYWFRFNTTNRTKNEDFVIDVGFPPLHEVAIYDLEHSVEKPLFRTGKLFPYSQRPIDHRTYAFPVKIESEMQKSFLIKVKTQGAVQIPIRIFSDQDFRTYTLKEYAGYGGYYGIVLVMALYNLFLFFATKDRSYIYYVLYILNLGLLHMSLSGVAFQWLWPEHIQWNKICTVFFVGTTSAMLLLFSRSFLSTKRTAPKTDKFLFYSMIVCLIVSGFTPISYGKILIKIAGLMGAAIPLLVLALAIYCVRNGNRPARYFLAALGFFLLGSICYSLKDIGLVPANAFTENGIVVGSIIEITLLSLGLADKINVLESEKQRRELEVVRTKSDNDLLKLENEKNKARSQLASQVAHDIRSPLAALSHAVSAISTIPEESRIMIRGAANRINDIANNLINSNNHESEKITVQDDGNARRESILSLVDKLVTEKRTQFQSDIGVTIDLVLTPDSYGLFANVVASELQRVLSNVINNAVEALPNRKGHVRIELGSGPTHLFINIVDDGVGISPSVAERAFEEGFSHGKVFGSGLGLYHANTVIKSFNGQIKIEPSIPNGTTLTIELPQISPPDWFVPMLRLRTGMTVVIVDDDPMIHRIWESKFAECGPNNIEVVHFNGGQGLKAWLVRNGDVREGKHLFLFDYELISESETGLDLIERLGLEKSAILVTSRYEEDAVLQRCLKGGIRMIPKSMASLVGIQIQAGLRKPNAVLIDNDPLIQRLWHYSGNLANVSVDTFSSPELFLADAASYDKDCEIYLDSILDDGKRGEDYINVLRENGFHQITMTTGLMAANSIYVDSNVPVGTKTPPWEQANELPSILV